MTRLSLVTEFSLHYTSPCLPTYRIRRFDNWYCILECSIYFRIMIPLSNYFFIILFLFKINKVKNFSPKIGTLA